MRQVPDKLRRHGRLLAPVVVPMVAVLALAATAAACTSSKNLTAVVTTTTAAPTTTARPRPTYPMPPQTPISVPQSTDSSTPDGSGCEPASATTLTDGIWFGVLETVDATNNTIGLDLACWYSARPSGSTTSGTGTTTTMLNDYHITNNNPTVYTLKVAPQVAVLSLAGSGTAGDGQFNPTTTGIASANAILTDQSRKYVWVMITHGYVTVIQGQFTP